MGRLEVFDIHLWLENIAFLIEVKECSGTLAFFEAEDCLTITNKKLVTG